MEEWWVLSSALVAFTVEDARQKGFWILSRYPCVQAQYKKYPDWADVMAPVPDAEPGAT